MTNAQEAQAITFSPFTAIDNLLDKMSRHKNDKEYMQNLSNYHNAEEYVLQNVQFPAGLHVLSMVGYIAKYVRKYAQENI